MFGFCQKRARESEPMFCCSGCGKGYGGEPPYVVQGTVLRERFSVCSPTCKVEIQVEQDKALRMRNDKRFIRSNIGGVQAVAEVRRSGARWHATAFGCKGTGATPANALAALALATGTESGEVDFEQRVELMWPEPPKDIFKAHRIGL